MFTPADAFLFPPKLNRELSHSWNLRGSTVSPGQSGTGAFPLARFDGGGLWTGILNEVAMTDRQDVLCWRAVRVLAKGGVAPFIMPRKDVIFPPFPLVGGVQLFAYPSIPHSDGSFFGDGSGYYQPVIVAQTVGAALLRDTTLTIAFTYGGPLLGGESFSLTGPLQGKRLHEISTVAIDGNGNSVVTFDPPLREDYPGATVVEFDKPGCTVRLADPKAMDLELTVYPLPRPSVAFVEYFYPTAG
jgi:hypothetical protein